MKLAINKEVGGFRLEQKHVDFLLNRDGWYLTESGQEQIENSPYVRTYHVPGDITRGEFDYPRDSEEPLAKALVNFRDKLRILELKIRSHPDLIEAIETLKDENDYIGVVEIPDGIDVYIEQTEMGNEVVHEVHRTWF